MADEEKAPVEPVANDADRPSAIEESRVLLAISELATQMSSMRVTLTSNNNAVSALTAIYDRDRKANDARFKKLEDEVMAGVHASSSPDDFRPPAKSITSEVRESIKVQADRVDSLKDETAKQTPMIAESISETKKQTPIIQRTADTNEKIAATVTDLLVSQKTEPARTAAATFVGQACAAAFIFIVLWLYSLMKPQAPPLPVVLTPPSYSAPATPNR